jgi:hypothetical protein
VSSTYVRVSGSTATLNNGDVLTLTASCPGGKLAVGGGGQVTAGDPREPSMTATWPSADNVWSVTYFNVGWYYGMPITVRAWVTCL